MSIDLHTLSGAYSIDALSSDESDQFDTHLEQCPACREEVRELQEAAARMGASEALTPPPSLKARILAAADQQPQLPPLVTSHRTTDVTSIDAARSRRWTSRLVTAAAAVVLVAAVGLGITLNNKQPDQPVAAPSVSQVFHASDARTRTFTTSDGSIKVALSAESGRMAISTASLHKLTTKQVYQLWAVHNGQATSIAVLRNPTGGQVVPIPGSGTTVAITVEPSGGSKHPTTKPIVEVDPRSV